MYKHPFVNDPFRIVYTAFKNLFPECDCDVQWDSELEDEDGKPVFGTTTFADGHKPLVNISPSLTMYNALEILGHELAHVAVGIDGGHGSDWKKAFDSIHREYLRLLEKEEEKSCG